MNAVVLMRLLIGWHFLYEGVIKLFNPHWTSKAYMLSAQGFGKPLFTWLGSDSMIGIVDTVNILCLIVVGVTLLLGYLERFGSLVGIVLLLLYYLAHPAFPGMDQTGTEGSYYIINKNLIEAAALYVIYLIPTAHYFGLKGFVKPASLQTIASN
jgi:thiosulfate dehydrogenase (quinone) large subunit